MWTSRLTPWILGICLIWSGVHWLAHRPINPGPGLLAPSEPEQTELDHAPAIQLNGWTLAPRATYQVTARVLSREDYRFDTLADLVPEDLALGWGPMSDSAIIDKIEISQSSRFYYWRVSDEPPIALETIADHSANTHVIPADKLVARTLNKLRIGDVVTLRGELVDGTRGDGAWFKTSMVRTDRGAGACEVLLVRDALIAP